MLHFNIISTESWKKDLLDLGGESELPDLPIRYTQSTQLLPTKSVTEDYTVYFSLS